MIPYAKLEWSVAGWFVTCPVCGKRIDVRERKDFESFTLREYRIHYRIVHG